METICSIKVLAHYIKININTSSGYFPFSVIKIILLEFNIIMVEKEYSREIHFF